MKRVLLLSAFFLLPSAFAVKTEHWEITTAQDFLKGKLHRLTVSSEGEVRLGYGAAKLGEFAKEIWCSTVARDGSIYFGTGSPADVYLINKEGQVAKIFETDAIAVTALAVDSRGNVYVATMAEGKIFKIPAGKKEGAEFCRLRAPYVWSLAFDKEDRLYAGTGPDGKLYRIGTDGKAEEWFAGEESNLLSLAIDADGAVLAGGSDRGLLYRISEKGKGLVLHEFSEDEVKSLVVSGHDLYVGVNRQKVKRPRGTGARRPSAAEFEELTQRLTTQFGMRPPTDLSDRTRETPLEARAGNVQAGTLYKRNPEGRVDRLTFWETEAVMSLALTADGDVIAGTAGHGRVYRIHGSEKWELLFDLDEQQALTVAVRDGQLAFVGTGNIGDAYLIEPQRAAEGEYTSEVRDSRFLTTWGNLLWRGAGAISAVTRTGNTALPDTTWSAWSAPLTNASSKVVSPRARFIQVRVHLEHTVEPALQSLSLYSQIQNQKPEITSIELGEKIKTVPEKIKRDEEKPEDDEKTAEKKPDEPRPKQASTLKRVSWRATSKDGDTLVYRLYYRVEGDAAWVPVPLDKPLKKSEYWWDTESIPDGWYKLKVVASDEESNPAGTALTDESISESVKVDNRRPEVLNLTFEAGILKGVARDNLSLIRYLEYSVDGGDWKFFGPKDGVFDDREESFEVKPEIKPGPHTIAVRATDEEGNIGVEKATVQLK